MSGENQDAPSIINPLAWVEEWHGVNWPGSKILNSGLKKSKWPDHPEAIIGFLDKQNSAKGLPNPSPLVKVIKAFTPGGIID